MDKRKIIYYSDELNDEFSLTEITPRRIDSEYIYCHTSLFKRFTHFFWYRIIFTPIAFFHSKLVHHHKTVGKEKLKAYKKTAYFMYGNHTQDIGDAFMPNMINFPKTNYVIVHPNNVSMPFLGQITPSLGALPLPDDMKAYKNFISAIERRLAENRCIVIYPEAHIWPYFTGIRNFPDTSFMYPVKYNTSVFCFTNTYQKRRFSKKPRLVTYIDGPFFVNEEIPPRERKKELRDRVYNAMT
jgi:1-acyl-sn-glycerol-3-phosphate acyltransferase